MIFKESALGRFFHRVAMSVCVSVCLSVPFRVVYFEAYFAPTSRSRMSKLFRDSESLGKSAGKKWSQNWTFLLGSGLKLPHKKKFFLFADFALFCLEELVWSPSYYTRGALKTGGGCRASIAPVWSCRVDAWTRQPPHFFCLSFFLDKSRKLSKIVSVLRSASVERFFVSRMRDFFNPSLRLSASDMP